MGRTGVGRNEGGKGVGGRREADAGAGKHQMSHLWALALWS